MSLLPGDVVQTTGQPYAFLEVIEEKDGQVKCRHTIFKGHEAVPAVEKVTMQRADVVHVGVSRPVYEK